MTREQWLMDAVEIFRPWFVEHDKPIPEKVRVSVGYAKRAGKAIGFCYRANASDDEVNQIFISPELHDPVKVLATLVHELVHAADNNASGHRGEFARVAKALGLTGKMTATVPGEELTASLEEVVAKLGEYEHGKLNPLGAIKKQTTRMIKLEALCCGYVARTTRKWLDVGVPSCPCGNEMEIEVK